MPVCPRCQRDYDRAETLAEVCPFCGANVAATQEAADDAADTTAEFEAVDPAQPKTAELSPADSGPSESEGATIELSPSGDDESSSTVVFELPGSNEGDQPTDEMQTVELGSATDTGVTVDLPAEDLGATVAGDDAGTIEFDSGPSGDGMEATIDLPAKPPTTPIDHDMTIDLGEAESAAIGTSWANAAKNAADSGQTIRADPSQTIGQTVGGFRSSLPIKARSLHGKPGDEGVTLQPGGEDPAPDYELLDLLGQGGMGVVYAAKQSSIARTVAVKMLKPGGKGSTDSGSEDQRDKFISEAVITGELEHPNIVPIYDLGANAEGALFYSMKRVKGTPWDEVIAQKSVTENLGILMRVADAVAFAHANGVVHRDLKPENTMLGDYGEVLVMDWGLARVTEDFPSAASVHQSDSLGGTPTYMAPEMARGPITAIDALSDIYLLGAMLFEVCVGKPPHTGKNVMDCLMSAAANKIRPVDERIEARHPELMAIARRAMATNKADRYQSVKDFQAAIQEYLSHAESVALATSAEKSLAEARESGQYDLFSRALYGFEEALALWEGNDRAASSLAAARMAYARRANDNGDFDLAESLLTAGETQDAEVVALLEQIAAARAERNTRQQRLRTLKRLALGLLFAVVAITSVAYLEIRRQRNTAIEQREIAEEQRTIANEKKAEAIAQREIAEEQRIVAEQQRTIAQEQERIAVAEREEADRQRAVAEAQREAAIAARQAEQTQRLAAEEAKRNEAYEAYLARIGLAAAKIEENAFDEARSLLSACPPELRHWEWGRLSYLCGLAAKEFDYPAPVQSVAYSPEGAVLATGDQSGTLMLRSLDGGEARSVAIGAPINAIAFSPAGDQLAVACSDATVRLLDAETLTLVGTLTGHTEGVLSVDYSSDGQRIATSSYDQTVRVWDAASGDPLDTLAGHTWWVWSARFNPVGDRLVSAGHDGRVIVWRQSPTGFEAATEFSGHEGAVYAADFAADGRIASAGYDRTVRVWRPDEVQPVDLERRVAGLPDPPTPHAVLTGHRAPVRSVFFGQDGQTLLTGSYDNTLRLWRFEDATGWSNERTLRGHGGRVNEVAIAPSGDSAASAGDDNRVCLWELGAPGETRVLRTTALRGHDDALLSATFSPSGDRIVTASRDRTARVWNPETGEPVATLAEGHEFLATDAIVCEAGQTLVTIGGDGATRVWDIAAGVERFSLVGTGRNAALAVSEEAGWIATGSDASTVQLWSLADGTPLEALAGHAAAVTAIAAGSDGKTIASGDTRGVIRVWRAGVSGWTNVAELTGHSAAITGLRFLPGDDRLVSASGDRTCGQWDLTSGAEIKPLVLKHPDWVATLDVSADGKLAITSASDGVVRLWRLADATVIAQTTLDGAVATSLAFHAQGDEALITAASSATVARWKLGGAPPEPVLLEATQSSAVWSAAYGPSDQTVVLVGGNDAQLWRLDPATRLMRFSPHGAVADAAVSPDGKLIATASWDGGVKLWDAASGNPIRRIDAVHAGYLNSVAFTPDGAALLTAGDDGLAKLTPIDGRRDSLALRGQAGRLLHAAIDPAGQTIATAGADGDVVLWSAAEGSRLRTLSGDAAMLSVAISPDGKLVVGGSEDSTAIVWDARSGEVLHTLSAHTAGVTSVGFSPDGARIVTGSRDSAARVWDTRTGKEVLTLSGHTDEVTRATFHPDGAAVLTSSRDGAAIVWPAADWTPREQR